MECDTSQHGSDACLAAFLVWSWPVAIAAVNLLMGAVAYYLTLSVVQPVPDLGHTHPALRPLCMIVTGMVLAVYITSAIAGVQMALANVVMEFMVLMFVIMLALLIAAFGKDQLSKQVWALSL